MFMPRYRFSMIRGMRSPFVASHFASFWNELKSLGYVCEPGSELIELNSEEDLAKIKELLGKYQIDAILNEIINQ